MILPLDSTRHSSTIIPTPANAPAMTACGSTTPIRETERISTGDPNTLWRPIQATLRRMLARPTPSSRISSRLRAVQQGDLRHQADLLRSAIGLMAQDQQG